MLISLESRYLWLGSLFILFPLQNKYLKYWNKHGEISVFVGLMNDILHINLNINGSNYSFQWSYTYTYICIYFFKIFFFFCYTMQHVKSQFPNQGPNVCPLHWEHGVLITGPAGKSLKDFLWKRVLIFLLPNPLIIKFCLICSIAQSIYKYIVIIFHHFLNFLRGRCRQNILSLQTIVFMFSNQQYFLE